jgi:hypothetical protein
MAAGVPVMSNFGSMVKGITAIHAASFTDLHRAPWLQNPRIIAQPLSADRQNHSEISSKHDSQRSL